MILNLLVIQTFGLHHYKGKLSKYLLLLLIPPPLLLINGFQRRPLGGPTDIRILEIYSCISRLVSKSAKSDY